MSIVKNFQSSIGALIGSLRNQAEPRQKPRDPSQQELAGAMLKIIRRQTSYIRKQIRDWKDAIDAAVAAQAGWLHHYNLVTVRKDRIAIVTYPVETAIDIIGKENLAENITARGDEFIAGLREFSRGGGISNVRGVGSLVAFTLKDPETRGKMLSAMFDKELLALASGEQAIRFRLPLVVTSDDVRTVLERIEACLPSAVGA